MLRLVPPRMGESDRCQLLVLVSLRRVLVQVEESVHFELQAALCD